jgi:ATP-binding cassette subfamily C protein
MLSVFRAVAFVVGEMLRSARRETLLGVALLSALALTEGAGLLMLTPLLELIGVVEENPLPQAAGWLSSAHAMVGISPSLGSVLTIFVAVAAGRSLLQRWHGRLSATVRERVLSAVRLRAYRGIASAEWRFLATRPPASLVHALTAEVGAIGATAGRVLDVAAASVVTIVYVAVALRLAPGVALLVIASASVLAWSARHAVTRARISGETVAAARRRLNAAVAEHVAALKAAKAAGATPQHSQAIAALSHESEAAMLDAAEGDSTLQQHLEFGSVVMLAVIVYVSVNIISVAPALLLLLLYVFARLLPRLMNIYRHVHAFAHAAAPIEALRRLEAECAAVRENADAMPPMAMAPFGREVHFDHVSFGYRDREAAIDKLTLRIAAGQTTAIVGGSGSGKTTIAELMVGLLRPTGGRIEVDGVELTASRLASWRAQIAYVPHDAFLFNATVRENVRWPAVTVTDAAIWEALRLASAQDFVAALPDGLDTVIGDRGSLLSAGERQRLTIARALLRGPRLIVFDEATSSLDPENEARIQQAIDQLHHRVTVVVIAHRFSLLRRADTIHVLDGGRIVQSGRWEELHADRRGRFHALAGADRTR